MSQEHVVVRHVESRDRVINKRYKGLVGLHLFDEPSTWVCSRRPVHSFVFHTARHGIHFVYGFRWRRLVVGIIITTSLLLSLRSWRTNIGGASRQKDWSTSKSISSVQVVNAWIDTPGNY